MSKRVYGLPALPVVPTVRNRDFRSTERTDYVSVPSRRAARPDLALVRRGNMSEELMSTFSGFSGADVDPNTLLDTANIVAVEPTFEEQQGELIPADAGEVLIPEVTSEAVRGEALNYGVAAGATPETKYTRLFEEITREAKLWNGEDLTPMDLEQAIAETVYNSKEAVSLLKKGGTISSEALLAELANVESGASKEIGTVKRMSEKLCPCHVVVGIAALYLLSELLQGKIK